MPPTPDDLFRDSAIICNSTIPGSLDTGSSIQAFLQGKGFTAHLISMDHEKEVVCCLEDASLLIVLGGDGTTLRAARVSHGREIPILGVNFGRIGFLSEVEPVSWKEGIEKILAGDYWIEQRMMLKAERLHKGSVVEEFHALNEVVISRGGLARVIWLRTFVNDAEMATYIADGLIISTPTGSTAYALAAGGPVLPPDLRNILIQPIAPHMTLARAVVLSEGARIRVVVQTDHQAALTIDGQVQVALASGDEIALSASQFTSRFIRLGSHAYFYDSLLTRLNMPFSPGTNGTR